MQWDLISKEKKRAKAEKNIELPLLPKCVPQSNFFSQQDWLPKILQSSGQQTRTNKSLSLLCISQSWCGHTSHDCRNTYLLHTAFSTPRAGNQEYNSFPQPFCPTPCLVPSLLAPNAPQRRQDWGLLFQARLWNVIISQPQNHKERKGPSQVWRYLIRNSFQIQGIPELKKKKEHIWFSWLSLLIKNILCYRVLKKVSTILFLATDFNQAKVYRKEVTESEGFPKSTSSE